MRRRTWLWVLGLTCVAVLGYVAVSAMTLLAARARLLDGVDDVRALRRTTTVEDLAAGTPLPGLRRAERRLDAGRERLRSPLVAPLRVLPVVGRQVRSADALARSAVTAVRVGIVAVTDAREALAASTDGPTGRVEMLERLARTASTALAGIEHVDLGPRGALVSPLARARRELAAELAEVRGDLRRAESDAGMLAALLRGPRRFLLVAGNNAEMRAGFGMFLQAGELTTDNGRVVLSDMRSTAASPVPSGTVVAEGDLADRWGWQRPTHDLASLMLSPRFDVNAPLAARMWEALGHDPVDGVIAIDPLALQAVLRATGPADVDGRVISADTVVDELLFHQYQRFGDRSERREELGLIARSAFDALDAGRWQPAALARELSRVAGGRHLLAWSKDATEQRAWRSLRVDGSLGADSLLIGFNSRAYNKLDRWLSMRASLDLRPDGDRTEAIVRIDIENRAPVAAARYVVGPNAGSGVGEGVYRGILAVSVPGRARAVTMEGAGALAVEGPDGPTWVVGAVVDIARGERRTVDVRFTLPRRRVVRVEPSARFPHIDWRHADAVWRDVAARRVTY